MAEVATGDFFKEHPHILEKNLEPVKDIFVNLRRELSPLKPGQTVRGTVSFTPRINNLQLDNVIVCLYGTCKSGRGENKERHILVKRFQDCTPSAHRDGNMGFVILQKEERADFDFAIPLPNQSFCPCARVTPGQENAILPPSGTQETDDGRRVEVKYQLIIRVKAVGHPRASHNHEIFVGNLPTHFQRITPVLERQTMILRKTDVHRIKLDKVRFPSEYWSMFTPSESKALIQAFVPSKLRAGDTVNVRVFMLFSVPPATFKIPGSDTEAIYMEREPDRRAEVRLGECSINMRYKLMNLAHEVVMKDFAIRPLQHTASTMVDISNIRTVKELQCRTRLIFPKDVRKMYGIELTNSFPPFVIPSDMVQYASCGVATNEFSLEISGKYEVEMEQGHNTHTFKIEVPPQRTLPLVDVWDEGSFRSMR